MPCLSCAAPTPTKMTRRAAPVESRIQSRNLNRILDVY